MSSRPVGPHLVHQALRSLSILLVFGLVCTESAPAAMSSEELAKLAQNPIANLNGADWQLHAQVQLMFPK